MVAPTTPFPRSADKSHALSWESRPNLALRHDPIVSEAVSLRHLLCRKSPNEARRPPTSPRQRARPLIRSRQRARPNRRVRKTGRNLNSRRGLRKARHPKAGTSLTRGPSSTGC
jgi:hypothetical protein